MRIGRTLPDPSDPKSIVEYLARSQRIIDGFIEVGSPQNPNDPASTTLADGSAHNGTLVNMAGAWVEVDVTAADTKFDCVHNLGAQVLVSGGNNLPNVRWQVMGFQHNGTGAIATSTLSVNYDSRDQASISTTSFPLRLYVGVTRTVNGGNPVRVTLFFTPAVR